MPMRTPQPRAVRSSPDARGEPAEAVGWLLQGASRTLVGHLTAHIRRRGGRQPPKDAEARLEGLAPGARCTDVPLTGIYNTTVGVQARSVALRLADKRVVNASPETTTKRLESLTAHVDPLLAAELRHLAEVGERSVSRQVEIAIKEHVFKSARGASEWRAESPGNAAGPGTGVDPARTGEAA